MKFDVVIIGGGLAGLTAGVRLLEAGKTCCAVSAGRSLHEVPFKRFRELGGVLLSGDKVEGGEWDGDRLVSVSTRNLADAALEAPVFILSTGKFFSCGLVATPDTIFEPLFGCDVLFEKNRDNWYSTDFFKRQPFENFGLRTEDGLAFRGGRRTANLYPAGEILEGEVDIIQSALDVCGRII